MKNWKVKTKLIAGFGVVIIMSIAIAAFAYFSLNAVSSSYENQLDYSQQRVQTILELRADVINIRRIATLINAYTGDVDRQEGYKTDSAKAVSAAFANVDKYTELAKNDPILTADEINQLVAMCADVRDVTDQYKRFVLDPNIEFAIKNDREGLLKNSDNYASLVSDIQATIDNMVVFEQGVSEGIVRKTDNQVSFYLTLFIIIAVIIAVVSLCLALAISNIISKPLIPLNAFMHKAGTTGDITMTPADLEIISKYAQNKDEIGHTIGSCAAFVKHVANIANGLETVAGGDLTVNLDILSGNDVLGKSLRNMVDNLNNMFAEIRSSTAQVSTGSAQIADSAQVLSQGAAEQSSTVEQLSAAIAEISEQTKRNAQLANEAKTLGNNIKESADQGNRQMAQMIQAIGEISESSQSIGKVIKIIDDIAFQTNILALNAAVEAARAGQHGKGFAVVADEVRNLAAKSAEAAKDTGVLIETSVAKSEIGAKISSETASSLAQIIEGIIKNSELVSEISQSSGEQASAITQIIYGIDQVSQVVQQNSATSEENAAASEEMSNQADLLQQLISRFKLKNFEQNSRAASSNTRSAFAANPQLHETGFSISGSKY